MHSLASTRSQIVATFAEWTALSALRSGAPIKSRQDVYRTLRAVDFDLLFDCALGTIGKRDFDEWHTLAIAGMMSREPRLSVGWAAKILNVYLKTRVYVGGEGRPDLVEAIHPPIDGGLWFGLARRFPDRPDILEKSNCVARIKDIRDQACYARIIEGCREAATALECSLIEVEQLWTGTELEPGGVV